MKHTRISCMYAKLLQLCPTLWDPMDCTLSGSSVHGSLEARILEWIAISSSRGFSQPRNRTQVSYVSCIQVVSLPLPLPVRLLVVNQVTKIFILKFDRIARTCKQPKCPCIEGWIKIYIYTDRFFFFLTQP